MSKYSFLSDEFFVVPIAVKTSCALGPKTEKFLRKLGAKISIRTYDLREVDWLFQRFSIAVIRGNSLAIRQAAGPSFD